jgi:AraC-like DNA-binding protein
MDEHVSIADAAGAACMSPYHFLRSFRTTFRVTPHQFLTMLGSFSSLFRRHFGVSPQDMQRAAAVAITAH